MVAAWNGESKLVTAFLVGTVGINLLFLLGICFINGGHHTSKTRYPLLMASIHARMLPPALAVLVCAASTNVQSGGKY